MEELEYKILCKIGKVFVTNRLGYKKFVGEGIEALKDVIAALGKSRTEPLNMTPILQHWEEKLSQLATLHIFDIGILVDNETFFSLGYEIEEVEMLRKYIREYTNAGYCYSYVLKETPKEPAPVCRPKLHAYDKRRNYAKKNYWNRIRSRLF